MPNSLDDIGNEAPAYGGAGQIDNCIVQSQVVGGNASFLSTAVATVTLTATATDPFEVSVAGKRVKLTANVTLVLTNNAHNFIYIDQTGALSRVGTPPTYAFTAPGGPSVGDMWFDLGKNQMKSWNGAAWVASNKVHIGYQRIDANAPTGDAVSQPIGAYPLWIFGNFGNGTDGFLDVSAGTTTLATDKQYTAIIVRGAGVLTNSSSNGPLVRVKSQNMASFIGTSGLDLLGTGRAAGAGAIAIGAAGGGNSSGGQGGGGGGGTSGGGLGGSQVRETSDLTSGGGAAGAASGGGGGNGSATLFGPYSFDWGYALYMFGAGGGGGGGDGTVAGGNGGIGGGAMVLWAPVIDISTGALCRADGAAGTAGSAASRGGGGGGGGGLLYFRSRNFFNNGTFTSSGGNGGGSGGAGSGAGGNGGAGVAARTSI